MCSPHTRNSILGIRDNAREFSYKVKKNPIELDEEMMNEFLDNINLLKKLLIEQTDKINEVIHNIEQITWIDPKEIDEECLKDINDIISTLKDLHSSLIRQFVQLNPIRKKGIAKSECKAYKGAMDDIKDSYADLESVFFYLPEMPGFVETTKQLSLI